MQPWPYADNIYFAAWRSSCYRSISELSSNEAMSYSSNLTASNGKYASRLPLPSGDTSAKTVILLSTVEAVKAGLISMKLTCH